MHFIQLYIQQMQTPGPISRCNVRKCRIFLHFYVIGIDMKEYGKFAPWLTKSKL